MGMVLGTLGFMFGMFVNQKMMSNNNEKGYFPFQKVVMPIGVMILMSLVFFFIVY